MRAHEPRRGTRPAGRRGVPEPPGLLAAIGNRGLAALAASPPPAGARGLDPALRTLTSPANDGGSADPETADPTTPTAGAAPAPAAAPDVVTLESPLSLTIKGTGAIEGRYGIGDYWPVPRYWGADTTLGAFDEPSSGGWRMKGHKFQVVGEVAQTCPASGIGGRATFVQQARLTNTKGGTPGPWFDDMDYTDAGGGKHAWDPNTESGTTGAGGNPGVGRTLGSTRRAYTDPPAISYRPKVGTTAGTSTYRKLEFRIRLVAPPGSGGSTLEKLAAQEIEVVDGVVTVHQAP